MEPWEPELEPRFLEAPEPEPSKCDGSATLHETMSERGRNRKRVLKQVLKNFHYRDKRIFQATVDMLGTTSSFQLGTLWSPHTRADI